MSENVAALTRELDDARQELVRVQEELRKAQARGRNGDDVDLATAARLRREARTHLNTVLGFAQLLKSSAVGSCEPVQQIFSAATRLAELMAETPEKEPRPGDDYPGTSIPRSPAGRSRVLYIEDNTLNCQLVGSILGQRKEMEVMFAKTGSEGLRVAREWLPNLVLLDLNLPDMHGRELLIALHTNEQTAHIPVVVVSADATATQIENLLVAGARNYLTKPIDVTGFLFTVEEILRESRAAASADQSAGAHESL
jgi:CheY-like chemotaxis protein